MTMIKPGYHPRYPEYKGRCRMRCGDIWRCGGPKKKKLLSYEELTALVTQEEGVAPIVNELNTAPLAYYNKYLAEGHLYEDVGKRFTSRALSSDGTKEGRFWFWADTVEYGWKGEVNWMKVHHNIHMQ